MERLRARWVLPVISPPVEGGIVSIENGRIVAVEPPGPHAPGSTGLLEASIPGNARGTRSGEESGDAILLPAPVNAHTHVEWSFLRGRSPSGPPFTAWVRALLAGSPPSRPVIDGAMREAAREIASNGVFLVGDHCAGPDSEPVLREAGLAGVAFHEIIGLPEQRATELLELARERTAPGSDDIGQPFRRGVAPHGPHTVSRRLLESLSGFDRAGFARLSIHLAESVEETAFLGDGGGAFLAIHRERGGWDGSFRPPALSSVRYADTCGLLTPRTIAVHCVHLDDGDAAILADRGTTAVLCPRSNERTGAGRAPLEELLSTGVRCALGTDSLASVDDLDMSAELAAARGTWPRVPPETLVAMATVNGARALGFAAGDAGDRERTGGTFAGHDGIAPGRAANLAVVFVPRGTPSGADPCAILCGDYGRVRFRRVDLASHGALPPLHKDLP